MAIGGGIKFFNKNKILEVDGATIASSVSGDILAEYAIDKNPITFWTSIGSSDATTEELIVQFTSQTFDRLILQNHNFKGFNVQYWSGAGYSHFAAVVGLDGALSNITETAFADDTAYYEFTPVTTTRLRIQCNTTQVANAQKFISQIIFTEELGTLSGYPIIKSPEHSRNERVKTALSGKAIVQKGIDSFGVVLDFDRYPSNNAEDITLMMELFDSEDPFLVWLCGGRRGTTYFRHTARGFRLRDVYQMQATGKFKPEYYKGIYTNPLGLEVKLVEHV